MSTSKDKRKIQRLHTDLGEGKNKDIFLQIITASVVLAVAGALASHWHQRCARLSVIAKKMAVFLESTAPALSVTPVVIFFRSGLVSDG